MLQDYILKNKNVQVLVKIILPSSNNQIFMLQIVEIPQIFIVENMF